MDLIVVENSRAWPCSRTLASFPRDGLEESVRQVAAMLPYLRTRLLALVAAKIVFKSNVA